MGRLFYREKRKNYYKQYKSILMSNIIHIQDPLTSQNGSLWAKADGWANPNPPFNCGWRSDHCGFDSHGMKITLSNHTCSTDQILCSSRPYASCEYRTNHTYGYGTYSVYIKPIKAAGVISSFFVYNGTPHNEIDIEFLGNDTTKVQFNYFAGNDTGHESVYALGFDASEDFHKYSFTWTDTSIAFKVDDMTVHTLSGAVPTGEVQAMMNVWNTTGVDSWAGHFTYTAPLTAYYKNFAYESLPTV